ncbi:MAG: hypothetical protein FVQ78_06330 [Solirubrobacterales bacterium]|nr:hypothetical protein [Solirubrobacterales bacterium]
MSGPVILATWVGGAAGSRAAAAALACAGSEPDRAGLLVDLTGGRPSRPSLIASAAARELEERLTMHLPKAGVASRGRVCHLALPADPTGIDRVAGALAVARGSVCVLHLPPRLLQPLLEEAAIRPSSALLRADLGHDRALTALAVRDLIDRGLQVAVLKHPIGWIPSRRALAGVLPGDSGGGLPERLRERLLGPRSSMSS